MSHSFECGWIYCTAGCTEVIAVTVFACFLPETPTVHFQFLNVHSIDEVHHWKQSKQNVCEGSKGGVIECFKVWPRTRVTGVVAVFFTVKIRHKISHSLWEVFSRECKRCQWNCSQQNIVAEDDQEFPFCRSNLEGGLGVVVHKKAVLLYACECIRETSWRRSRYQLYLWRDMSSVLSRLLGGGGVSSHYIFKSPKRQQHITFGLCFVSGNS